MNITFIQKDGTTIRGRSKGKGVPCLPDSCAFCGSTPLKFAESGGRETAWCDDCHNSFEKMFGQWKFDNEGWPESRKDHNMRHRITRILRSELHDHIHGKEIEADRLKFLIALLLDHHCHLEGAAAEQRMRHHPPMPRPHPRRPPLPPTKR